VDNNIGNRLKALRSHLGLSQDKFCNLLGIGVSSFKKYETGRSEPGYSVIERIANHPETKKYLMWLLTNKADHSSGQFKPGKENSDNESTNQLEYESQFLKVTTDMLDMFDSLNWIKKNAERNVDFTECAKFLFKDLEPVIKKHYGK
jgi:transcriptional regulator with XRE-family HTH domain